MATKRIMPRSGTALARYHELRQHDPQEAGKFYLKERERIQHEQRQYVREVTGK